MTQNRSYEDGAHAIDWHAAAEDSGVDAMDVDSYAHELYLMGMSQDDDGLDDFDFE